MTVAISTSTFLFFREFILNMFLLLFVDDIFVLLEQNIDDTRKSATVQQILQRWHFGPEEAWRQYNRHRIEVHFVVRVWQNFIANETDHIQNDIPIQCRQTVNDVFDEVDFVFFFDSLQSHHFVVRIVWHNRMVEFGEYLLDDSSHSISTIWPGFRLLENSHRWHLWQSLYDFLLFLDRTRFPENAFQFHHLGILPHCWNQTHQMNGHIILIEFVLTQPYGQTIFFFLFFWCYDLTTTFLFCPSFFVTATLLPLVNVRCGSYLLFHRQYFWQSFDDLILTDFVDFGKLLQTKSYNYFYFSTKKSRREYSLYNRPNSNMPAFLRKKLDSTT